MLQNEYRQKYGRCTHTIKAFSSGISNNPADTGKSQQRSGAAIFGAKGPNVTLLEFITDGVER